MTLLEVLVALTLFALVAIVVFAVFNGTIKAMISGRGFADEHQNSRLVLEWMTRRLRLAGLGVAPGTAFTQATATSVAFRHDADRDGSAEARRFCWDVSEGAIREEAGPPSAGCTSGTGSPVTSRGVRAMRVVLLDLRYFRGDEVELVRPLNASDLRQVRRVRITLGLDSNRSAAYEAQRDLTFTMDAVLRNQ